MVNAIDRLDMKKSAQLDPSNHFRIHELKIFNAFIIKTINELQHANRVKSNFLMNMSHDFRTPASGIYNMASTLYKRVNDPLIKQYIRLIVDSSDKLMQSLDDILDYTRLDSGQYTTDHELCDIKIIINEVATILLPKAVEKGIKLSIIHKLTNKISVKKRILTHRLLLNIISNAIKYTENGIVTVTSTLSYLNDKRCLAIKIKDTGIGIDKQYHQSIFEPFYRLHSDDGGVGLGLSNAKAMIQNIGGKIEVMSEPGFGSQFTVYLPIHLPSQRSQKIQKNDESFS
jgi:signal transduction histidine kinase